MRSCAHPMPASYWLKPKPPTSPGSLYSTAKLCYTLCCGGFDFILRYALYTLYFILYTLYFILYTLHFILYTLYCATHFVAVGLILASCSVLPRLLVTSSSSHSHSKFDAITTLNFETSGYPSATLAKS